MRTLPGRESERTGESANGIASSVCTYVGNAKLAVPVFVILTVCVRLLPRGTLPKPKADGAARSAASVLEWKKNQKNRNKEEGSPGPNQAEAGHRSHLCYAP